MSYPNATGTKPTSINELMKYSVAQNDARNYQSATHIATALSRSVSPEPNSVGRAPRLYTAESLYEINNLPVTFEIKNINLESNEACLSNSDYAYVADAKNWNHEGPTMVKAETPNPYKNLPQYQTFNYFEYGTEPVASLSIAGSDTNTVDHYNAVPDVFGGSNCYEAEKKFRDPIAPQTETLNKRDFETSWLAEVDEMDATFDENEPARNDMQYYAPLPAKSCETLNKRLITQESIMDLCNLPAVDSKSEFGMQVLRDFCVDSMEDLRLLPSWSSISLNHAESDVNTAQPIILNVNYP